jgi:hypothetical protein
MPAHNTRNEAPISATDARASSDEPTVAPFEPLLPVEVVLITSCVVLGILLLGVLLWLSNTFFPVSDPILSHQ